MRAPGDRLEREPGKLPLATSHYFPRRHGGLAGRVGFHPPASGSVLAAERQLNAAFVGIGTAFHHRPIGLADPAALEQPAELGQRLAVTSEYQAAGGIAVEPM